ncbi:MAG: hypothetical protein K8I30_01575 [Anaerolineae bacterium]|nr:hypothetical protein [Anaerolineae bacterium]
MPIQYAWNEPEKKIIRYTFMGKWSWDEVYEAFQTSWGEAAQLDHVVDSISDMTQANSIPPSAMTHVRSLGQKRPMNTGVMVIVGANSYVRIAMQSFQQIIAATLKRDLQVQFAKEMDEAYTIIAEKQEERRAQKKGAD